MIRTLLTARKALTLRNDAPNLFDIDSISLLIGKNGSGKTLTLQEVVHAFGPHRARTQVDPCKVLLDTGRPATPDQLRKWGVVYYTPAQNRPKLRSTPNFINASKRPVENLHDLDRYADILNVFELRIELTATLRAEYRKIARLLAEALLKTSRFRTLAARERFDFEELDQRKRVLDNVPEFEASQSEYDQAEVRYSEYFQTLTEVLLKSLHESASPHGVFACAAVVTHLIEKRQATSNLVIALLKEHLGTPLLPSLQPPAQLPEQLRLVKVTEQLLKREYFTPAPDDSSTVGIYTRPLMDQAARALLERLEIFKLCRLGYPEISSGQWAIMQQTIALYESLKKLRSRGKRKLLVLIDEGDAFLHLEWQRQYVYHLNLFLSRCKTELDIDCLQLLLATHSPLLATDIPRDFVATFDNEKAQPSFGAPMQLLLNRSFGARSIGEFAIGQINQTLLNATDGQLTERDHYIRSVIEDPVITREIDYLLSRRGA